MQVYSPLVLTKYTRFTHCKGDPYSDRGQKMPKSIKSTNTSDRPNKSRFHVLMEDSLIDAGNAYVERHKPTYTGLGHLLACLLQTRLLEESTKDTAATPAPKCRRKRRS